ncbi:ankyrin, partial [Colletotrichum caudatum]
MLLELGADPSICSPNGYTALHWLTPAERHEALTEYMLRSGAPVNARTKQGITPLLASVLGERLDLTNLFLKHGADPNIAAAGGCTPLIAAAMSGRQDLVRALLASGADPNAQLDVPAPENCSC